MADNVKPTYARSDVKSGVTSEQLGEKTLGGVPAKKDVEEIDEVNTVHKAPNSTSV